jgi:protein-S-isoprenylcysteine O-methyltransferase Ste14
MHLRIPPPIVALIGILLIFLSKDYILILYLHPYLQNTLSILFLVVGFVIILLATKEFKKSNTTVNPMKPETSTSLVTSGIFKYTRNPMYLGLSSILLASCFYFSSLLGIIVYVPFFILYITVFQIIPEEEVMKSLFNDEYLDYCSKVRRWI